MMQPIGNKSGDIDARYRILLILWIAMLMSVGFLFVLTILIGVPTGARPDNVVLLWTFSGIGTFLSIISFVPKRKLIQQATEKQEPPLVFTGYIIAFAFCESAGIFALLLFFVMPGRGYIYLFAISTFFLLVHYPRRVDLMAASFKIR